MALDYTLTMSTGLNISDICLRVEALVGETFVLEEGEQVPKILMPSVIIAVYSAGKASKKVIPESYGFEAALCVGFRLDKFEKYDQGLKTAVSVSLELLRTTASDDVLEFNGRPDVLRRNGKLILDPEAAQWNHAPAVAKEPYILEPISANGLS